ncbi:hypothetical protein BMT55_03565 [Listeria newyorkensis]|uniref:DUF4352 domain-containing protein n=1 Tax=Listeria newyorkensis TaxID=1497681 RepID=A0ABX4XQI0_9LIST|nr:MULTISPECIES: DUF4352 domain-containing protein [Listeria]KGL41291.1 hypothetical protein EP56_11945 [Listeriaceae bacterium FSL A5-0209]KGL44627.1 hypothetical protein EP58_03875 [Listeria newyorkensis]KMT62323.1 lipoprotein [Listeria newyorkensis]PNP93859.1 hypothetical protein BMT55_03565 [Listeria newyorkensis]RQW67361.1 DUF4352 domain-containing protein [Listeria sp. SHR_NRA_18]
MKKKKILLPLFALTLTLVMILAGCGGTATPTSDETSKTTATTSDDVGKTRTANDLEITLTNIEMKDSNDNKKEMAKIDFSIKNTGKEESGAGAGDFVIKTKDGKKHQVYGLNANNFGDVIQSGKTLKGSGYYEIPAGQKEFTVLYEPFTEMAIDKIEWAITIPSK